MKNLPKFQPSNIRLRPRGLTQPGAYTSFDLVGVRIGLKGREALLPVLPQPDVLDYRHVVVITAVCTEGAYAGHRITNQLVVANLALPYHKELRNCVDEWQTGLLKAKGKGFPCYIAVASIYDLFENDWWLSLVPGAERPTTPGETDQVMTDISAFLGELA